MGHPLFSFYISNEPLVKNSHDNVFSYLNTVFGTSDREKILSEIKLMCYYWGAKINPEYSSRWTADRVGDEIKNLKKDGGQKQAALIWQKLVYNIYNQYTHETELQNKIQKEEEIFAHKVEEAEKKQEILLKQAITDFNVFEKKPNSIEKIVSTLTKLDKFQKQLKKQYPDIPNYKELKKIYAGSNEAEVINIAYRIYFLDDYESCLEAIDRIKNYEEDSRLLSLKIYGLQRLNRPNEKIISTLDRLLQLEPNNERAFMMKRTLEAKIELQNRKNGKSGSRD